MKIEKLETNRLILEPQVISHAKKLFEGFSNINLYEFIKREPPTNLEIFLEGIKFLESRISPDKTEHWLNWVIIDKLTKDYIGQIEVSHIIKGNYIYLAYTIFEDHWRKGYAKEACKQIIDYLNVKLKLNKVVIEMDTLNLASIKLAESLGAKRVSHNHNVQLIRGRWSDEFRYEIIYQPLDS